MSDYDDEIEEETPQALDPNIRKQLREAEKARKELDSLRAELNAERREVQFAKVGIPDDGIGKLFRKAYDGEADADSIRKAAEEYGILGGAPAPQSSNQSELEALLALKVQRLARQVRYLIPAKSSCRVSMPPPIQKKS